MKVCITLKPLPTSRWNCFHLVTTKKHMRRSLSSKVIIISNTDACQFYNMWVGIVLVVYKLLGSLQLEVHEAKWSRHNTRGHHLHILKPHLNDYSPDKCVHEFIYNLQNMLKSSKNRNYQNDQHDQWSTWFTINFGFKKIQF